MWLQLANYLSLPSFSISYYNLSIFNLHTSLEIRLISNFINLGDSVSKQERIALTINQGYVLYMIK